MSIPNTYLLRHAPSTYSVVYRINGDPTVDVPLTAEGVAACRGARSTIPREVTTCVTSTFDRCHQTAEFILPHHVVVQRDGQLNELDYGEFEGESFLAYARWLATHGPYVQPPGACESQVGGILRMLHGLRDTLNRPGPRLVVAHGLLASVVQWARSHPYQPLNEVFLAAAPCVNPLVIEDAELELLITWLLRDLSAAAKHHRVWHVDLGAFPREVRTELATVSAHAFDGRNEDEATHA